jgi:hypothetical protein
VGADTAADTPTHVPTMACAWNVSLAPHARCPPLPHVYRLRGEGGKGVLPPNMCPLQPWVCVGGESAPQPPTTPPTLPPRYVLTMRPRRHPHAVRHSHMYVDCGARPKQGCCPPTCARSSPGCVWVLCCGRPTLHPTTPANNVKICAWHVSLAPPARCPPLSCVCRWQGGGWAGVLPANMCLLQPWVCGWVGLCLGPGARTSHTPTHVPTVVYAYHASLAPPACCPPLSYVFGLWGEGGAGVLPPSIAPVQPWVCGLGLCCGHLD